MRVLVTDGDARAALAVTRSLGRNGHDVFVGERRSPALAHVSRYCRERLVYADPATQSNAFVDDLRRLVSTHNIEALLPVTDITTLLVARHRDQFPASCAIPLVDHDVLQRAADKIDMVRTAERLGVPAPASVIVNEPAALPDALPVFPVVIKPGRSRVLSGGVWRPTSVSYAEDLAALRRELERRSLHEFPVMIQERIEGPGLGVFACYHRGEPVALFSHRRLRERPPSGGVSVLSESTPLCPLASEYANRLLRDLRWHGVAMVEFKRDIRDGLPKLMEINGRFWGSLQLAVDAGVDFPALLLRTVTTGRFDPQPSYRIGVRNRWLLGDLDSLLLTLKGGGGNRLRAVAEFLELWGHDLYYESPRAGDLRPSLLEAKQWLSAGLDATRQKVAHG